MRMRFLLAALAATGVFAQVPQPCLATAGRADGHERGSSLAVGLDASLQQPESPGAQKPQPAAPGSEARAGTRKPPFPGTRNPHEILANLRFAMMETQMYKRPGLEALLDLDAIRGRRVVEVQSEDPGGDYFIVDVDTKAGAPLVTVLMRKASGLWMSLLDYQEGRTYRLPVLASVSAGLKERFGAGNARYFFTPSNLGRVDPYHPLIVADTPKGRVLVNCDLEVFVESEFEKDPPGLTRSALAQHRTEKMKDGAFMFKENGMIKFVRAGNLTAEIE
jgi:hypothetical protein